MKRLLISLLALSACTSGVQTNSQSGNAKFTLNTNQPIAKEIACIDDKMKRSSFNFGISQTSTGWELTVLVYGGPLIGWFPKAKAIRDYGVVDYYADAADLGLESGVRSIVEPILRTCANQS